MPPPIIVPSGAKQPSAFLPTKEVIELVISQNALDVKDTTNILTYEYKKPIKTVKDILLDCDTVDDLDGKSYKLSFLSKLPVFIFWVIVTVILCMLGFILYGRIFDVPNFLKGNF